LLPEEAHHVIVRAYHYGEWETWNLPLHRVSEILTLVEREQEAFSSDQGLSSGDDFSGFLEERITRRA